jgi:hypothetical protein
MKSLLKDGQLKGMQKGKKTLFCSVFAAKQESLLRVRELSQNIKAHMTQCTFHELFLFSQAF